MEFEREFNKVDNALSAAALSATIIRQSACSHQDIATLESLVPGMIFDNQWAYGFTNEASLENFQKVKEVVSNAIKTAIAKIRELIKRFMDFFKSKKNQSSNDAKQVSEDVKDLEKDVTKSAEKQKREVREMSPEEHKALNEKLKEHVEKHDIKLPFKMGDKDSVMEWIGGLAAETTNKFATNPNDESIAEFIELAKTKNKSLLTILIGDNVEYGKVLNVLIQYQSPAFRKNIFMLTNNEVTGTFITDIKRCSEALVNYVNDIGYGEKENKAYSANIYGAQFGVDSKNILSILLQLCGKKDVEANNATEYITTASDAITFLFKDAKPETKPVITDIEAMREFIAEISIQKNYIIEIIPVLEKALDSADKLKVEARYTDADQPSTTKHDALIREALTEIRLTLGFMNKLNSAQNELLLQIKTECDKLRTKLVDFD